MIPSDWRPINLSNTSYKILSKVLNLRLKNILHVLLDPCQGSFTKERGAQPGVGLQMNTSFVNGNVNTIG